MPCVVGLTRVDDLGPPANPSHKEGAAEYESGPIEITDTDIESDYPDSLESGWEGPRSKLLTVATEEWEKRLEEASASQADIQPMEDDLPSWARGEAGGDKRPPSSPSILPSPTTFPGSARVETRGRKPLDPAVREERKRLREEKIKRLREQNREQREKKNRLRELSDEAAAKKIEEKIDKALELKRLREEKRRIREMNDEAVAKEVGEALELPDEEEVYWGDKPFTYTYSLDRGEQYAEEMRVAPSGDVAAAVHESMAAVADMVRRSKNLKGTFAKAMKSFATKARICASELLIRAHDQAQKGQGREMSQLRAMLGQRERELTVLKIQVKELRDSLETTKGAVGMPLSGAERRRRLREGKWDAYPCSCAHSPSTWSQPADRDTSPRSPTPNTEVIRPPEEHGAQERMDEPMDSTCEVENLPLPQIPDVGARDSESTLGPVERPSLGGARGVIPEPPTHFSRWEKGTITPLKKVTWEDPKDPGAEADLPPAPVKDRRGEETALVSQITEAVLTSLRKELAPLGLGGRPAVASPVKAGDRKKGEGAKKGPQVLTKPVPTQGDAPPTQELWSQVVGRREKAAAKKAAKPPQPPVTKKPPSNKEGGGANKGPQRPPPRKTAAQPPIKAGGQQRQTTPLSSQQPQSGRKNEGKSQSQRHPAVILTCAKEGYTDALRRARGEINLTEIGITDLRPRRALTGALIMEVRGAEGASKADTLAEKLRGLFAEDPAIKVARPAASAEIRLSGLDEATAEVDIKASIAAIGGAHPDDIKVGATRPAPGGLRTAWVKCPAATAKKVVAAGKVSLGWFTARVEALTPRPLRCFKCWEGGHVSASCPKQTDRSNCCFRCGQEGHKAGECTVSVPRCAVCAEAGRPTGHRAGGPACPVSSGKKKGKGKKRGGGKKSSTSSSTPSPPATGGGTSQAPTPMEGVEPTVSTPIPAAAVPNEPAVSGGKDTKSGDGNKKRKKGSNKGGGNTAARGDAPSAAQLPPSSTPPSSVVTAKRRKRQSSPEPPNPPTPMETEIRDNAGTTPPDVPVTPASDVSVGGGAPQK